MSPSILQVKHINQYREKTAPYPLELLFAHFTTTAIWSTRSTPSTPRVRLFPANVSDLLTHLDICKGLDTQRYIYATLSRNHPPSCARLCNFTVSRSCDPGLIHKLLQIHEHVITERAKCYRRRWQAGFWCCWSPGIFIAAALKCLVHEKHWELRLRLSNCTEQRQPHNGWQNYRNSKLQWV